MSYILDTTPLIDHLGTSLIAKHTEEDPIFSQLLDILSNLAKNLPKSTSNKLQKFEPILDKITISGNNILLKSDRILPEAL